MSHPSAYPKYWSSTSRLAWTPNHASSGSQFHTPRRSSDGPPWVALVLWPLLLSIVWILASVLAAIIGVSTSEFFQISATLFVGLYAIYFALTHWRFALLDMQNRHVQRYERDASDQVNSLLVGSHLGSLVTREHLLHPPRRPHDLGLKPRRLRSISETWVCSIITQRAEGAAQVQLKWVVAPTVDDAFNIIAPTYGWRPVREGYGRNGLISSAYRAGDSLVLIEPERCLANDQEWSNRRIATFRYLTWAIATIGRAFVVGFSTGFVADWHTGQYWLFV